jgi:hypothetical protein
MVVCAVLCEPVSANLPCYSLLSAFFRGKDPRFCWERLHAFMFPADLS